MKEQNFGKKLAYILQFLDLRATFGYKLILRNYESLLNLTESHIVLS